MSEKRRERKGSRANKRSPVFLPLPLDRLFDLWHLLAHGGEIDAQARADLERAVSFYHQELWDRVKARKLGRRFASETWRLAFAAKVLVEKRGLLVKSAIAALLPRGNAAELARVHNAYQKLVHKRGPRPRGISVDQSVIDAALARLKNPPRKRAQTGNK
jgi:hypothetical protein